jgi:hypothetical protein
MKSFSGSSLNSDVSSSLNLWYGFGSILALVYGFNHLFRPHTIATSWGKSQGRWQSEETVDFIRLLGIWILFQSFIALVVALRVKDIKIRYYITLVHVFKNFGAFVLRVMMWRSGRYGVVVTSGFQLSTFGDLLFVLGYGYFILFPEKISKDSK